MDDTRDITPKDKGKSKVGAGMKHFNARSWLDELRKDFRAQKDRGDKLKDVLRLRFDISQATASVERSQGGCIPGW